jgi:catechol 2,3-dioxygenase-like lactoylglutathione lyase family enzyme
MEPRLDLLTLAVPDLDVARRFYLDGLGWPAALDVPGEILFLQVNHGLLLGLFGRDDLEADMVGAPVGSGGFTLAHVVDSPQAVDEVVGQFEAAGATVLKAPQRAAFGGYHAYVEDPSGLRWEVAHNPGLRVHPDGTVTIGPVDQAG